MKHFIQIITAVLLALSATSINGQNPLIEIGDHWDSKEYVKLSEITESIEYLALEKTDECILPSDNSLGCLICEDLIFVRPYENPIVVFSRQGKFKFKLGGKGKGPGDYINGKVQYDFANGFIWILDIRLRKLLKFDQEGLLLKEIRIDQEVSKFVLHNSMLYVLSFTYQDQGKNSEMLVLNADGEISKRIPLYPNRDPGVGSFASIMNFFGIIDGKIAFNEAPFTHGFVLNELDQWEESWSLEQGKKAVKPIEYYPSSSTKGEVWNKTAVMGMYETPNYIFIRGMSNRYTKAFVYNKNTDTVKANHVFAETENTRDMHGVYNDFDGGLPFQPRGRAGKNSYVQINDALRYIDLKKGLLKYYGVNEETSLSPKLRAFCETLEDEDNPVLMIVSLK